MLAAGSRRWRDNLKRIRNRIVNPNLNPAGSKGRRGGSPLGCELASNRLCRNPKPLIRDPRPETLSPKA